MLVHSGNPVHSLADSQRMREAMRALEQSVVVDVSMTETAREADYVLPSCSQFEKAEATFFNLEFPRNVFHLRQPLFEPLPGTLPEAEIYARLLEVMGELSEKDYAPLRRALKFGRTAFGLRFFLEALRKPKTMKYAPILLYRVLGPTLPKGMDSAAALWGIAQLYVQGNREAAKAAGFGGLSLFAGEKLFRAILDGASGMVYSHSAFEDSWRAVSHPDHRINLHIPELLPELAKLAQETPQTDADYPFVLSAGERRSDTSNTAVRDTAWHRKGAYGTLRLSPQDAAVIGCKEGDALRLSTRRASVEVTAEISAMMQPGHISLPNGQGLDYHDRDGHVVHKGVAPNELTDCMQRDFLAGTPWHKFVPARLERIGLAV
jgi:formate dehydrogenase